jgi:hypothetical protein
MKNLLSVIVLAGVSLVAITGCDSKIEKTKIEGAINDGTKAKGISFKSVECPANQMMKKGADFDCTASTAEGDAVTIHVTQNTDQGDVTWNIIGTILDPAKLGDSIESKLGAGADVKCPASTIVLTKGKVIKCTATVEGATKNVEITATDDAGNVDWKVKG